MPINNSRISISVQEDFIKSHSENVKYYRGMKCPCSLTDTGSNLPDANRANPSCQACKGLGWIWIYEGEIKGIVTGIKQEKELLVAGIASPGDLVFVPDMRYTLSDYDKIQLTWTEGIPFEGELIIRGTSTTDTTTYGVMSVDSCISVDSTTGIITNYIAGTDFTFNGTTITWSGTNKPPPNSIYSIKYQALIDWIAFTPPQPRRERGTNLGQLVLMRKKHLVFNGV